MKQGELLVGKLVVTGQEGMREDLCKKRISADPIAARLPASILTRLVELRGWKKLELNKLVRFNGVAADSLASMFRRTLVIIMRARFLTQQVREMRKHQNASVGSGLTRNVEIRIV